MSAAWMPSVSPDETVELSFDFSAELGTAAIVATAPDAPVIKAKVWKRSRIDDANVANVVGSPMIRDGSVYVPVSGMKAFATYQVGCKVTTNEVPPRIIELVSYVPCTPA